MPKVIKYDYDTFDRKEFLNNGMKNYPTLYYELLNNPDLDISTLSKKAKEELRLLFKNKREYNNDKAYYQSIKYRPQNIYQKKMNMISKSYKLNKTLTEEFKKACDNANVSISEQLTNMMQNFINGVNDKNKEE